MVAVLCSPLAESVGHSMSCHSGHTSCAALPQFGRHWPWVAWELKRHGTGTTCPMFKTVAFIGLLHVTRRHANICNWHRKVPLVSNHYHSVFWWGQLKRMLDKFNFLDSSYFWCILPWYFRQERDYKVQELGTRLFGLFISFLQHWKHSFAPDMNCVTLSTLKLDKRLQF